MAKFIEAQISPIVTPDQDYRPTAEDWAEYGEYLDGELSADADDAYDPFEDDDADSFEGYEMSDVEADADTLASAGWGTDEDYGCFGGDDW